MTSEQPEPIGPGVREVHEFGNRTYLVADVEPLDVTGVRTIGVGTLIFAAAALAMLPFYGWLDDHSRLWWFWSCVVATGLGVYGWTFCRRRARQSAAEVDQHGFGRTTA